MGCVGVTLRNSAASGYHEDRDALARDWYDLFQSLGWQWKWMLLPNLGENTADYAKAHGVTGVILTGGDDPGKDLCRDVSECTLLSWCRENQLPVLGICRGMQMLHCQDGGQLVDVEREAHIAKRHYVTFSALDNLTFHFSGVLAPRDLEVNSYHARGVALPLCNDWQVLAQYGNTVEAFVHRYLPWVGIMWHPEREPEMSAWDRALFLSLFRPALLSEKNV